MWEWGHENVTTWTSQYGNVDFTIWQRNKVKLANNQIQPNSNVDMTIWQNRLQKQEK
jgi:hypothetical protein